MEWWPVAQQVARWIPGVARWVKPDAASDVRSVVRALHRSRISTGPLGTASAAVLFQALGPKLRQYRAIDAAEIPGKVAHSDLALDRFLDVLVRERVVLQVERPDLKYGEPEYTSVELTELGDSTLVALDRQRDARQSAWWRLRRRA